MVKTININNQNKGYEIQVCVGTKGVFLISIIIKFTFLKHDYSLRAYIDGHSSYYNEVFSDECPIVMFQYDIFKFSPKSIREIGGGFINLLGHNDTQNRENLRSALSHISNKSIEYKNIDNFIDLITKIISSISKKDFQDIYVKFEGI